MIWPAYASSSEGGEWGHEKPVQKEVLNTCMMEGGAAVAAGSQSGPGGSQGGPFPPGGHRAGPVTLKLATANLTYSCLFLTGTQISYLRFIFMAAGM